MAWAFLICTAWAAASLYRATRLVHSAWRLHLLSKNARVIKPDAELASLLQGKAAYWSRRSAELCSCEDVDVPSVVGFFRPRILLPSVFGEEMSPADIRQIILHEMQHLGRRDDWTNLFQKLTLVVFPLNVALLWLERRLCVERELACDDGVLRLTGSSKAYATCLTNLAEQSLMRRSMLLALGAGQHRSELELRVDRILNPSQRSAKSRWSVASAGLILAVVSGVSVLCVQVPAILTFRTPDALVASDSIEPANRPSAYTGFARPTLVKALMPCKDMTTSSRKRRVPQTRLRDVVKRENRQAPFQRIAIVREERLDSHRLRWAVAEDSQFTYAALPIRGGWLIVQL
ncbi:M56 family metallopeptidase [Granulicella mallensis]|uniref:M56 family metallopeptidase n=1 Tax=Granulicella mallensis TaxID=940614 RepID=UPI0021A9050E|nr:M56 family metallopeptidase [Granulicella mallensis]